MKFEQQLSQQQKQTQKLALTQQLQQSLQVLHYSSEELFDFINQQTLDNPLIELNDRYFSGLSHRGHTASTYEVNFGQLQDNRQSLFDFLVGQVHLNYRDTALRNRILRLIEYIDPNGWLVTPLDQIAKEHQESYLEWLDALTLLQQLDPPGIGAQNLQECLMLQTERDSQAPELAYLILESYFMLFVERKWAQIAEELKCSINEIQRVFDYVQTLTPKPGAAFEQEEGLLIIPDLEVMIDHDNVSLTSLRSMQPPLKFNQAYYDELNETKNEEVTQFLKSNRKTFDWLKQTLDQRENTILRIGELIVQRQISFFLEDHHPLNPLTMREVAEALELHESTVSRAVNKKYMSTPFGTYELKSFFTTRVLTSSGEEIATTQVKEHLKRMIEHEEKRKPLSDQKLADLLSNIGFTISRRTVTKYREALGLPTSKNRKRFE
ncbi:MULTISPECIES: RNA polymerase factor sigma-54 [Enterococcus]|uniref:RNA polymerase sigma-54 factor n=1 Tax=Enterococcus sulfureus ATCC 49903 TaxID=1140003 RepID=S0KR45_9ENTE|nr:RNA polymerase factor sigma-54 [Enterococcus sulfureus]EOT47102.1 RNA polymerase sigma-54 factor [Enterococcus sulfureus ATCC 49903]EOT83603.1 RNA polymerase sigma-54 factor [Enterococcus sulfureus ATCC 49903]